MGETLTDSEKISQIYLLLTDEKIGLCGRVQNLEHTVNGNGSVGLAEEVRSLKSKWAYMVTGATMLVSGFFHLVPIVIKAISKKAGG